LFGSLIISAILFLASALIIIYTRREEIRKVADELDDVPPQTTMFLGFTAVFAFLFDAIKVINRNGYVYLCLTSKHFLKSSIDTMSIFKKHNMRYFTLFMTTFIPLIIVKWCIIGLNCTICYMILIMVPDLDNTYMSLHSQNL
jgi:hypothetical protein